LSSVTAQTDVSSVLFLSTRNFRAQSTEGDLLDSL